ncbi:neutral zinc metallopeptidase [Nonomuraea dietziae]|uniref:neutral zinc metallopeptidase n=1 Tax=Nonomuraea dietziae TaxID=65515 RepID=UPI0033C87503
MRFPFLGAAATAVLALLLVGGTAVPASAASGAYPIKGPRLTKNTLYGGGPLRASSCPERPITADDRASARRYVLGVYECLNTSWGERFAAMGVKFTRPGISFTTRPTATFCDEKVGDAAGVYCTPERRFTIVLDKKALEYPHDLFLFDTVAHEYAHHVQNLTGITRAFEYEPFSGRKEELEQTRRFELQAECLAGVFIGSVWDSLDRTEADWEELLLIDRQSGDEVSKVRDHGKGRNIADWLDRGFRTADPASCNTWTAPASKVS